MGYTHGIKWTDEKVENEILSVVKQLNIDHFPTHVEMMQATGNKALACRISKTQGTLFWAEKLGIPIKFSETSFGNRFEIFAIEDIFENCMLTSVHTSSGHPFDIYTNNSVKIDVKVSKVFINNNGAESYSFNLEKKEPTCDIYLLYCVNGDESIDKTLVVPSCLLMGQSQMGVGITSKWDIYKEKWDYINEYSDFFSKYKLGS